MIGCIQDGRSLRAKGDSNLNHPRPIHNAGRRPEPRSMMLADLLALILGSAFAVYLPQIHFPRDRITIGNFPMPEWIAWHFVITEVLMKVGLALVPVILARRARYGGLPTAADWLPIVVALPLLDEIVRRLEWSKRLARWYLVDFQQSLGNTVAFPGGRHFPGRGGISVGNVTSVGYDGFPLGFRPGDQYRLWGWLATGLLVAILAALACGWKRMPASAKTALLTLAAFTWLAGVQYLVKLGLIRASTAMFEHLTLSSSISVQLALAVANTPQGLLFGVPIVAMLTELRKGRTDKWIWTGWTGSAAAVMALLTSQVVYLYADSANGTDTMAQARLNVEALRLVFIGLASWFIVQRCCQGGIRVE
jgi:hypothetical protein